jgi:hypothetical protein
MEIWPQKMDSERIQNNFYLECYDEVIRALGDDDD